MSCGCGVADYSRSYQRMGYDSNMMGMKGDEPAFTGALMNAAYAAAVGAAEGYLVYGYDSRLLVPGLGSVSAPVGFAAHTLLGSLVGQYLNPVVQTGGSPIIPVVQEPVLAGVGQVSTHMLAGNTGITALNAFLIGSTSEYIGQMIQNKI